MKKYYIDHPEKHNYEIEIDSTIVNKIIKDYTVKTYYWSFGIMCAIIGFLLGVIATS